MNTAAIRRKLAKARRLTAIEWLDLMRAAVELARARASLHRVDPRSLVPTHTEPPLEPPSELVSRVAWAIPIAAEITPWRSDCLVQAFAAKRWLAAAGVDTQLNLGVASDDGFAAHAWLSCGPRTVTGGEVSRFMVFSRSR